MPKPETPDPVRMLPLTPVVFSILLALSESEKHGYAIMKEASLPEGGAVKMGPGTLYGSLDRMMQSGLVEETGLTDNERRRYYCLTRFGQQVLSAEAARLAQITSSARRKGLLQGSKEKAARKANGKALPQGARP
jgi:DNA-binding PadR family transcriptional regulator